MKKSLFVVISLCALAACKNQSAQLAEDSNIIEYQIQDNEYAVVVVQEGGMSDADAKQQALKKAAILAQKNNYRYFQVEKEEQVEAMSTENSQFNNPSMPGNMYYNLIQSGNFGRQKYESQQFSESGMYPAYRITFKCYQEKPSNDAIDACTLVDCKK